MLALDNRPRSRTKGSGHVIPSKARRRFAVPLDRPAKIEKRDMIIYNARVRDGCLIADLVHVFGLSARQIKYILADVKEYLEIAGAQ